MWCAAFLCTSMSSLTGRSKLQMSHLNQVFSIMSEWLFLTWLRALDLLGNFCEQCSHWIAQISISVSAVVLWTSLKCLFTLIWSGRYKLQMSQGSQSLLAASKWFFLKWLKNLYLECQVLEHNSHSYFEFGNVFEFAVFEFAVFEFAVFVPW